MATLELHLKGAFFQVMDIELPAFRDLVDNWDENFAMNCQLREDYLKQQIGEMRANYIKQIIKCQHDFEFYLVVRSKMGEENLLTDSQY